jgi:ribosomal protein L11 methylase PrmA
LWSDYYENNTYSDAGMENKKKIVDEFIGRINPKNVWDLGANTGLFSRVAAERGSRVLAFDVDPAAVERNYRECAARGDGGILPLVLDLTNPSPGIGWENSERMSLLERGPADAVLAMALVHHLAISNNLPLAKIAAMFSGLCRSLIIEFVPKDDSQVQRLLATREDIFPHYHARGFEAEFSRFFSIVRCEKIEQSGRSLYLMKNKSAPDRNSRPDR